MKPFYKTSILTLLIFTFLLIPFSESQRTVEGPTEILRAFGGNVLDENNQPLSGVQVIIKGANYKTVTDSGGYYTFINPPLGKHTLQFSLVWYETYEKDVEITTANIQVIDSIRMKSISVSEPIPVGERTENINAYSITIKDSSKLVFQNNPKYYVHAPDKIIYRTVFTKQDEPVEIYDNTEVIYTLPFGTGTRNEKRVLKYDLKGSYTEYNDYGILIRVFYDNRKDGKQVSLQPSQKEIVPGVVRIAKNRKSVVETVETCPVEVDNTRVFSEIKLLESFAEMKERARKELAEDGITREQREAYKTCVSEMLYKGIIPAGYQSKADFSTIVKEIVANILNGRDFELRPFREDAWRFYLGLPQQHNTFGISDYQPSKGTQNKYYYNLPIFREKFQKILIPEAMKDLIEEINLYGGTEQKLIPEDYYAGVMRKYILSKGHDEKGDYLSYYDLWDIAGEPFGIEGKEGFFGKPFEIYDRIYYDPETFEIIEPEDDGRKAEFDLEELRKIFESALCSSNNNLVGSVIFNLRIITGYQVKDTCLVPTNDEQYRLLAARIIGEMKKNGIEDTLKNFENIVDEGIKQYPQWDKSKLVEEFNSIIAIQSEDCEIKKGLIKRLNEAVGLSKSEVDKEKYNVGVCYYNKGRNELESDKASDNFESAIEMFLDVYDITKDNDLKQKTAYNLGTTYLRLGILKEDGLKSMADGTQIAVIVTIFKRARFWLIESLKLKSDDFDSKYNLEIVNEKLDSYKIFEKVDEADLDLPKDKFVKSDDGRGETKLGVGPENVFNKELPGSISFTDIRPALIKQFEKNTEQVKKELEEKGDPKKLVEDLKKKQEEYQKEKEIAVQPNKQTELSEKAKEERFDTSNDDFETNNDKDWSQNTGDVILEIFPKETLYIRMAHVLNGKFFPSVYSSFKNDGNPKAENMFQEILYPKFKDFEKKHTLTYTTTLHGTNRGNGVIMLPVVDGEYVDKDKIEIFAKNNPSLKPRYTLFVGRDFMPYLVLDDDNKNIKFIIKYTTGTFPEGSNKKTIDSLNLHYSNRLPVELFNNPRIAELFDEFVSKYDVSVYTRKDADNQDYWFDIVSEDLVKFISTEKLRKYSNAGNVKGSNWISIALDSAQGDCDVGGQLFAILARKMGLNANVIIGTMSENGVVRENQEGHGWVEIRINPIKRFDATPRKDMQEELRDNLLDNIFTEEKNPDAEKITIFMDDETHEAYVKAWLIPLKKIFENDQLTFKEKMFELDKYIADGWPAFQAETILKYVLIELSKLQGQEYLDALQLTKSVFIKNDVFYYAKGNPGENPCAFTYNVEGLENKYVPHFKYWLHDDPNMLLLFMDFSARNGCADWGNLGQFIKFHGELGAIKLDEFHKPWLQDELKNVLFFLVSHKSEAIQYDPTDIVNKPERVLELYKNFKEDKYYFMTTYFLLGGEERGLILSRLIKLIDDAKLKDEFLSFYISRLPLYSGMNKRFDDSKKQFIKENEKYISQEVAKLNSNKQEFERWLFELYLGRAIETFTNLGLPSFRDEIPRDLGFIARSEEVIKNILDSSDQGIDRERRYRELVALFSYYISQIQFKDEPTLINNLDKDPVVLDVFNYRLSLTHLNNILKRIKIEGIADDTKRNNMLHLKSIGAVSIHNLFKNGESYNQRVLEKHSPNFEVVERLFRVSVSQLDDSIENFFSLVNDFDRSIDMAEVVKKKMLFGEFFEIEYEDQVEIRKIAPGKKALGNMIRNFPKPFLLTCDLNKESYKYIKGNHVRFNSEQEYQEYYYYDLMKQFSSIANELVFNEGGFDEEKAAILAPLVFSQIKDNGILDQAIVGRINGLPSDAKKMFRQAIIIELGTLKSNEFKKICISSGARTARTPGLAGEKIRADIEENRAKVKDIDNKFNELITKVNNAFGLDIKPEDVDPSLKEIRGLQLLAQY